MGAGGPRFESWMAYMSLTVLAQSVVHVAIVATTEEHVMKKAKDLLRLFVISVIDVILTVLEGIS